MSTETFSVKELSVQGLFKWFDQQCLAVPEIQREFVWNAQRACTLLDSIYRGYPIGTAMVWRTGKECLHDLRHQHHVLPPFDSTRNREVLFLIDGQQRLSVLHQLRRGEKIYNSNGREIRFGDIYFSLGEEEAAHFLYLRRSDPALHFKVTNILSDRWQQMFGKLPAYKLRAIKDCRLRLLRYRLVFIIIKARDLPDVRETFLRINTQGMRITEAERAFSSASKVRPLHRFRHLCETLPQGYGAINKAVYWTALVLARGIQDLGQKAFARLTKQIEEDKDGRLWFERQEPRVAESIKLACDYLIGQLRVFDFKLLPYENMIAVLAVFFFWNNRAQPNRVQREQIRRWFWHTAVLKRYAGSGYRPNILGDVEFFKRLGQSRKGKYPAAERAPASALIMEDYSGTSALSRAFKLLLLRLGPRYITNGEEMPVGPVASSRNAKELHHIWPRDLLGKSGIAKKRFNALANMCYLVAHDNRSFGAKPPHRYFAEFRSLKHFPRAMRSHLIPYERTSALWFEHVPRGFKGFLEERCAMLVRAFNETAGMRLFEK